MYVEGREDAEQSNQNGREAPRTPIGILRSHAKNAYVSLSRFTASGNQSSLDIALADARTITLS
jgi:hypothetical protein